MVSAAVILRSTKIPARIDDSKRLTPRQRLEAFRIILQEAEVGVGIVCAQEIDQHNILAATLLSMQHALRDLPAPPDGILIDGLHAPSASVPSWPIVHGDQRSYVIACASIVAKVVRDMLMVFYHDLYPDYGFHQHKGYGTSLHAERLHEFGPSLLHRLTFAPVSRYERFAPAVR